MDFQSVNTLNVYLNKISGNLLPMTSNSSFSIFWKIYSVYTWSIMLFQVGMMIPSCSFLPKERIMGDIIISFVVTSEVIFMVMQIQTRRELVEKLIEKLNDILCVNNEIMKNSVTTTLESMQFPLKFYLTSGVMAVIMWSGLPVMLMFEKDLFYYLDYKMPVIYAKEPFSTSIFAIGCIIGVISCIYMFIKKVGVEIYMVHFILLITSQYRYIALKLAIIFRNEISENDHNGSKKKYVGTDWSKEEKEIRSLCRYHNDILHITFMLKKLISLTFTLIYVNSVIWFCIIGVMLSEIPSLSPLQAFMTLMYAAGAVVQLYILCSCVQQISDASIEITDEAFHEDWNRLGLHTKRIFMSMIMANNLECKLSIIGKFNLSLSSFMAILNQSYSITILLLKAS